MRRDVTHSAPGGPPMHIGSFTHPRWPLLWLAILFGGMLLLAFVFARMVSAADEGITLDPAMDLAVTEGEDASYTVVLTGDTPPSGDVTVTIESSNIDVVVDTVPDVEGDAGTTGSQRILTFTAVNYTMPQTVMLMTDDDDTIDEVAYLTHAVTSSDAAFNDIADSDLRVEVADDDTAGVTFVSGTGDDAFDPTTVALEVPETDASVDVATYTVVLTAEPAADVTVTISSDNADVTFRSGTRSAGMIDGVSVSEAVLTLTFTDANWDQTQNVETAVADDATTEDETVVLTHAITSPDGGYNDLADQTVKIEITDDDLADLTFVDTTAPDDDRSLDVTEDSRETYTVALAAQPTADVMVTINSSDNGAVGVRTDINDAFGANAQLTFTMDDYATAQTVTVLARADGNAVSENVTLSHAVASEDEKFNDTAIIGAKIAAVPDDATDKDDQIAAARNSLNVAVEAVDTSAGIRMSETTLTLVDGAVSGDSMLSAQYTVTLQAAPAGTVTVAVVRSDAAAPNGDVEVTPESHTFPPGTLSQTFSIALTEDLDTAAEASITLSHTITSSDEAGDAAYTALSPEVVASFKDDDPAGVTFTSSPVAVDEGGSGTYTVVLVAEPTAAVTVSIMSDNTDVTVEPASLTFVGADPAEGEAQWETAQTVTVNAASDANNVDEEVILSHGVSSADAKFISTALMTAAGDAAVADLEEDATDEAKAEARATAEAAALKVTVNVTDKSAGVRISETMLMVTEGGSDSYTVVLQKAPTDDVTVAIMSDNEDVTLNPDSLTFTSSNFSAARTVTVQVADDAATDDEMATLTHMVTSNDIEYDQIDKRIGVDSVAVEIADDTRAVVVSDISSVAEGGMASFTVVLSEVPSADVSVTVSSDMADVLAVDGADGDGNLELTFTTDEMTDEADTFGWGEPQTVMLTAAENTADEAVNPTVTITLSPDGGYSDAQTVMIEVMDNDITGVAISQLGAVIEGGSGEFTVVLGAAPTGDVTVTISSSDSAVVTVDEADADTGELTLTFTMAEMTDEADTFGWGEPQTVMVTAPEDGDTDDGSASLAIMVSSMDAAYNGRSATVPVFVSDNDPLLVPVVGPGLTISQPEPVDEGGSGQFTIFLNAAPEAEVTIAISSGNAAVTVAPTSLTFTADNFDTAQAVTVMAAEDDDTDHFQALLTFTVTSTDTDYSGLTPTVVVLVANNDAVEVERPVPVVGPGLTISQPEPVPEGGSGEFTIFLNAAPEAEVTIAISSGNAAVTVAPTSLTFTADNFDTEQTVTVMAAEDDDTEHLQALLTFAVTSTDTDYSGLTSTVVVLVANNDAVEVDRPVPVPAAGLTISQPEPVPEGGSGEFTISLNAAPEAEVTIDISSGNAAVTVAPTSLTFTADNFDTVQTVMVMAAEDDDTQHVTASLTLAVTSTDSDYSGMTEAVVVLVANNDAVEVDRPVPVVGPGLTISQPEPVPEGGSGEFTIFLNAAPEADVTIDISSGDAAVTVAPMSLTFTAADFDTAQTVMVMAAEDDDTEHLKASLSFAVTSTDSDYSGLTPTVVVLVADNDPVVEEVEVPGPTVTQTRTVTRTVTVTAPAPAAPMMMDGVIGSTASATATEVDGRVVISRHDGGASLAIDIGGFIRDESLGQTYQVVRRMDGMIVRQWVSPNSPLVYQIPWAVVNSQFSVPVGVIGAIPLDDQSGAAGQLVRRFDGGDDRIFSYEMGQWRHVPDIPTFQALGLYWCDVTAADAGFFDRITIGSPHAATDMPARSDYPSCSTG